MSDVTGNRVSNGKLNWQRGLMFSVVLAAGCHAATAAAQNYPVKPVRYVVPFAAGTGNDIVGR